jgi:hypothetical protein
MTAFQLGKLDAWISEQNPSITRPQAIRVMMEKILHIRPRGISAKPPNKAKGK